MGSEIEQMYLNLTDLLQDICKFLSGDTMGKLSPKDQHLAESLISRSKKQLTEISKIQPTLQCNEDYVVMNSQVITEDEEKSDIYSSVDDISVKPALSTIEEDAYNPYADLPAKDASKHLKCGIISMKRKFILGFETMRKVYASIHNNWLLIYCSEKDSRPLYTFDLKNYEVKESDGEKSNFELSCISNKKVYYFLALTPKDMLQWSVQINKHHDNGLLNIKTSDDIISNKSYENKHTNNNKDSCSDDEDAIYEELSTDKILRKHGESISSTKDLVANKQPPLPPNRNFSKKVKMPIKVPPPVVKTLSTSTHNSSEESLACYQEITCNLNTNEKAISNVTKCNSNSTKSLDNNSLSDDSGDATYEAFTNVQQNVKSLNLQKGLNTDSTGNKNPLPIPLRATLK